MWVSLTAMGVAVAMTPSLPVEPLTVTTANSPTKTSTSLHMATVRGRITCSLACSEGTMFLNKCVRTLSQHHESKFGPHVMSYGPIKYECTHF